MDEPLRAGLLARSVPPVGLNTTLARALHILRTEQVPWLPVLDGVKLAGYVTEAAIAERIARVPDHADVEIILGLVAAPDTVLDPGLSLHEAAAIFAESGAAMLPVLAWDGRYLGCLKRTELAAAQAGRLYPPRVGGMATPLGVYLTTGTVRGGVGDWGLVLAGAAMAGIAWLAQALLAVLLAGIVHFTGAPFARGVYDLLMEHPIADEPVLVMYYMLAMVSALFLVFLLIMRVAPRLAGLHAAEHQTVHAMEAGEPLTPEAVTRMPRAHPRCGTNLVALSFLATVGVIALSAWLATHPGLADLDAGISLFLLGVIVTLITWRRLGAWIQQAFTTRPATQHELESGIAAGLDVMRRHLAVSAHPRPRFALRLWRMGLPQALAGALLTGFLLNYGTVLLDRLLSSLLK